MLEGSASFSGIPGSEECESLIHNSARSRAKDASMNFSTSHMLWEVDGNDNEIGVGEVTYTVSQPGIVIENSAREETPHRYSTCAAAKSIPSQSKPKTLKDLQMEYYSQAIALQKVQMECFSKVSKLADVLTDKFS